MLYSVFIGIIKIINKFLLLFGDSFVKIGNMTIHAYHVGGHFILRCREMKSSRQHTGIWRIGRMAGPVREYP